MDRKAEQLIMLQNLLKARMICWKILIGVDALKNKTWAFNLRSFAFLEDIYPEFLVVDCLILDKSRILNNANFYMDFIPRLQYSWHCKFYAVHCLKIHC